MVGALAEGEGIYLRTIDEGAGIPTKEAHAVSYRSAKWIFDIMRAQKVDLDIQELKIEEKITEMEVRAILERILELGEGDIAIGYERGVQSGIIDSPLGCNKHYKGKVMGIRDLRGACRYLDPGDLPIPKEALEFHREKVVEREKAEGRKMDFRTVISDFWAFSKGRLIGNHP
jgi:methylaspartate mutase epsilon subunit